MPLNGVYSSLIVAVLGSVAILIWRVRESRRAVSTKTILIPPLGMATGFSMFVFAPQMRLRLAMVGLLFAIALALERTIVAPISWSVAYAYGLLWVAYIPKGFIRNFNKLPDISYGLYIYAFPVQQTLIATGLALVPWRNMLMAWVIVGTLATLSWYGIEKPALALKDRLGRQRDPRVAT